jgi:hypothetical protein
MAGEDAHAQHAHLSCRCLVLFLVALQCRLCQPPTTAEHLRSRFTPASDEALLWERARREHRKLSVSSGLLHDPVLEEYSDVAHRLLPPEHSTPGCLRRSMCYQSIAECLAYPTGAIYVHSGLLARLQNEAQLATVLAPRDRPHRPSSCHPPSAAGTEQRSLEAHRSGDCPTSLGPLLAPLGISVSGRTRLSLAATKR